jgi:hypothetical protein|eukprot:COSAG06_NODE_5764_length_3285_cov_2.880414_2_plen_73_part_00
MLLRVLVASCAVVLPFVTTPADGLAGLEHYESCEQCVAAGLVRRHAAAFSMSSPCRSVRSSKLRCLVNKPAT